MKQLLIQARLPDGVTDDGGTHVPLAVAGDTLLEKFDSAFELVSELFLTPRCLIIIATCWCAVFLVTYVLTPARWSKITYRHVAPVIAIGLSSWLVWLPGLRSHIEEVGFRYAQGAIIGLLAYFTYPLVPFLMKAITKHARRIVNNFTRGSP